MNQAASYWYSVPHHPNVSGIGDHGPHAPSGYATIDIIDNVAIKQNEHIQQMNHVKMLNYKTDRMSPD